MGGISAILTAAGESSRMGEPKPLLPWRGTTLIQHQVDALLEAGVVEIAAVLGHRAETIAPYACRPGVRVVVNPDYRLGKTTSILAGLRAVDSSAAGILLLAVDQPRTAEIIAATIRAHNDDNALLTSPWYRGRGGHPLIFSSRLRDELEGITEERQGIREVFQSHRREVTVVEIDDPLVRIDINTPEDYAEARRRFDT